MYLRLSREVNCTVGAFPGRGFMSGCVVTREVIGTFLRLRCQLHYRLSPLSHEIAFFFTIVSRACLFLFATE